MAVDTRAKRFSIMDSSIGASSMPLADGSFAQGDRQHLIWGYSGILWSIPVITTILEHIYHDTPMTVSRSHSTPMTVSIEHDTQMTVSREHSTPMG